MACALTRVLAVNMCKFDIWNLFLEPGYLLIVGVNLLSLLVIAD